MPLNTFYMDLKSATNLAQKVRRLEDLQELREEIYLQKDRLVPSIIIYFSGTGEDIEKVAIVGDSLLNLEIKNLIMRFLVEQVDKLLTEIEKI